MSEAEQQTPAAQEAHAKRAMELKSEAPASAHPQGRTSDEGMNPTPNMKIAPSGALHAEGQRPVLERSRKAR